MLCRSNVTCHAHENRTKYSSLMHFDRDSSVSILFKEEFVRKKLGTAQQLNNRFIDIRFIFHRDDIVRNFFFFRNGSRLIHFVLCRRSLKTTMTTLILFLLVLKENTQAVSPQIPGGLQLCSRHPVVPSNRPPVSPLTPSLLPFGNNLTFSRAHIGRPTNLSRPGLVTLPWSHVTSNG